MFKRVALTVYIGRCFTALTRFAFSRSDVIWTRLTAVGVQLA